MNKYFKCAIAVKTGQDSFNKLLTPDNCNNSWSNNISSLKISNKNVVEVYIEALKYIQNNLYGNNTGYAVHFTQLFKPAASWVTLM